MFDYIADGQTTIFDMLYPTFKIDKPIRLIELFAGVGSQAMALRDLGASFEHYRIAEWEVSAFKSYKVIHMSDDDTDYSKDISNGDLPHVLFNLGISTNGKDPMTLKEIQRKGEKWQRETYNNIKATNNLCSVCNFKGEDLGITDTDKYCYILTYSFPCQDLSVAGKMKGMAKGSGTRSGLLWEVERLLNEVEELPQVLLMENVPQVISQDNINDFRLWQDFLESKGYTNYVEILNAKDFGVAQNRERCFMVSLLGQWNYKFPQPIPLTKTMKDYLEDEVDEKYYINSEKAQKLIQQLMESGQLGEQKDNNIPCKLDKPYIDGKFISMTSDELSLRDVGTETAGTITARYYKGIGSNGDNVVITQNMNEVKQIGNYETESTWDNPQTGRVYSADGLSPTLNTCNGGDRQPKIVEPQIKQVGNLTENAKRDNPQRRRVYDTTGISPALCEQMGTGGNLQPFIVASRGRNPQNPSDRTPGADTEQRLEPNSEGICNTLTSVQKDNLVLESTVKIKQATKDGYIECKLGGVADLSYPTSKTRRGRVQDNGDTCPTLTATETGICRIETPYRIRKLTPLECWRLMDFTDEDFYKAKYVIEIEEKQDFVEQTEEKVNKILNSSLSESRKLYHIKNLSVKIRERTSNTQLYKQAGNSIVKAVLMAIFKQMM